MPFLVDMAHACLTGVGLALATGMGFAPLLREWVKDLPSAPAL